MLELAFLYDEVEEQQKAIQLFYEMIKVDPKFPTSYYGLATIYDDNEDYKRTMTISICLGIIGLVAIVWGGDLVVNAASNISQQLGMSENLVGLTVVALGTSLPELVTSVVATKKGELDIAIGNVVGSNIFNMLLILGSAAAINPMTVSYFAFLDLLFVIGAMFTFILLTYNNKTLSKAKGIPLVLMYVVYMIFTIIR